MLLHRNHNAFVNSWFSFIVALTATDLEWELIEVESPVYGEETEIGLDVTISFTNDSPNKRAGEGLWRVGMFGSESPEGARFGEVYQTLNEEEDSTTKKGPQLQIDGIASDFELGTIGCGDVQYVCVEFAKGDEPDPPFTMTVESGRGDSSTDTLITCKEQECSAREFHDILRQRRFHLATSWTKISELLSSLKTM